MAKQSGNEPPFTLGVEEEYLLVDLETMELAIDPPAAIIEECSQASGGQVTPELMRSQVEGRCSSTLTAKPRSAAPPAPPF